MAYLLDADVFIRAKNLHYGLDFCPAFWDWLIQQNQAGNVFSIEKVEDEVLAGADELSDWARQRGPGFFLRPDQTIFPALTRVSAWTTGQRYDQSAINTFMQAADYYLVAQALVGHHTLVTHEVTSGSTRKIKIPDAGIGLQIHCINPFVMLRQERASFVLGPRVAVF